LPELLARHHAILRHSIEAAHGHIFRIVGDAFCAAFFTTTDALRAALLAQRQLQQGDWYPVAVKVRMGINTGPAQASGNEEVTGGYTGYLTLTRAQRVMSVAYGGQILVSNASAELLRGELSEGVKLHDLGEHRLKGLMNPERLWQVTTPELLSEFPPLPSLNAIPSNLPVQLSSLIGRKREITEVLRLMQTTRLLTLTGVGGVGKTRLALQAAAATLEAFKDGVWLVELAPLADPALLMQSVAAVLGVREAPGRPLSVALVDYLRAKKVLLLLDNCEQLIEACAELSQSLLLACPDLHLIVSSREVLGISGETIFQVPSLALPKLKHSLSMKEIAHSEAVQLFLERARAVKPGFLMNKQNAPIIAQICQRLDGIPLAIELAAARIRIFSPEQILARLDDRFRLLTGGSRTGIPRQQTLRALIDWSYDLLTLAERLVLRQLSVFAGGWTFEAAEAVVEQYDDPSIDVLNLLTYLIDKSLVEVDEHSNNGEVRYHFLETIQQYADEKLLESGEASRLRDRHLEFFLKFAEETEPNLTSSEQFRWLTRLEAEHDNLRVALAWGLENDPFAALQLTGAVATFWNIRGYMSEGRSWITKALARLETLPEIQVGMAQNYKAAQAKVLFGLGLLMIGQGDNSKAIEAFRQSTSLARQIDNKHLLVRTLGLTGITAEFLGNDPGLTVATLEETAALSRKIGDNWALAMALGALSGHAWRGGDVGAAQAYLEESVRLSHKIGDAWNTGMIMLGFGMGAAQFGDYAEARSRFEECLTLFQKIGDKFRVNMVLSELAHLERRQGNDEQALPHYRETILAWQDLGHRAAVAHQLECFAFIAVSQEDNQRAVQLLRAAGALRENIGAPMSRSELDEYDQAVATLRRNLNEASFAAAWEKGYSMSMEDAVAYALEVINAE
jgi:predicted ATPase